MPLPRIYADFHNADLQGRIRLNTNGTVNDLTALGITLSEGLRLSLSSDDADERGEPSELHVEGVVSYSQEERCWVATIDWSAIEHASTAATLNGTAATQRTQIA